MHFQLIISVFDL